MKYTGSMNTNEATRTRAGLNKPRAAPLPVPIKNVVSDIRNRAGYSQAQLAEESFLTRQSVIRAEQNLHPTLSEALCAVLSDLDHEDRSPATIAEQYRRERYENITNFARYVESLPDYVDAVRTAIDYAADHFTPRFTIPVEKKPEGVSYFRGDPHEAVRMRHPLYLFRTHLFARYSLPTSAIKFCTLTGIHSSTVSSIEKGASTIDDSPALYRALRCVLHLSVNDVADLERMSAQCL